MSLKKQTSELDAKLKALRLRIKKCGQVIENRDKQTFQRLNYLVTSLQHHVIHDKLTFIYKDSANNAG